jgi:hypothetical protein
MDAKEMAALIVAGLTTSALILKKVHENFQTAISWLHRAPVNS